MEMVLHELKILPQYFEPVIDGNKTFEIRKDDREYAVGDLLLLKEYKDDNFTGHAILQEVTYITNFNQEPGYVVMGIKEPDFDILEHHFRHTKKAKVTR